MAANGTPEAPAAPAIHCVWAPRAGGIEASADEAGLAHAGLAHDEQPAPSGQAGTDPCELSLQPDKRPPNRPHGSRDCLINTGPMSDGQAENEHLPAHDSTAGTFHPVM